jgi:nicotinate-nucleotide--dimethylbenzimidazole phosphoribosyltransferase
MSQTPPTEGIPHPEHVFPPERKAAVYDVIYRRRDIRRFRPEPIPETSLAAILQAAHHAPSVGFMQPWNFILIRDLQTKQRVHALFARENQAAAIFFPDGRRQKYLELKLAGILDAPVNICVTCDPTRGGPHILGRNSIPETDVYSTAAAVENLWLAARAEGIGVGWVSILKNAELREILNLPAHIIPVAYLCVGYVDAFDDEPELQRAGWASRYPLSDLVYYERWGQRQHPQWQALVQVLQQQERRTGMKRLLDVIATIQPSDRAAMELARARQQQLTKPAGSLGRLEDLAVQIAGITGQPLPLVKRKAVIIMAGDHGVTAEGVSAYPATVTAQMVRNFLLGGAAINALARHAGAQVIVVDVGVAADVDHPDLIVRKVAYGTANMAFGPAMTRAQTLQAIQVGIDIGTSQLEQGTDLIATGDMGIGNTTAASAITAALTHAPVAVVTGHGTGISDEQLIHKIQVIERALASLQPDPSDPLDVLTKVGGLEIAGLVGVMLAAAAHRIPIVVDGFISGAAALVAAELCPTIRDYLIAGHASVERGHRLVLNRLGLTPLLDLELRLGEGTGAVLAMNVIEAALRAHREMATFAEAGVSERTSDPEPPASEGHQLAADVPHER